MAIGKRGLIILHAWNVPLKVGVFFGFFFNLNQHSLVLSPKLPCKPSSCRLWGLYESNVYWTLGNVLPPCTRSKEAPLREEQKEAQNKALQQPRCLKGWKNTGSTKITKTPSTWKALLSLVSCKDATRPSRISSSGLFLGKFHCSWL